MKITAIESIRAVPLISKEEACKQFGFKSKDSLDVRIKEMEESGRYAYSVIRDGKLVLINYLALMDYLYHRRKLQQKNLIKHVPPFDPVKAARSVGWYGVAGNY